MQRVEKLDILMTCQSVLRFLNLCNSNGVFIRDVQIPNVILFGLFLCPMIYEFIMIIWFALQTDMEMQSKSNVLCAGVAYLQMILTYITMIRSNKFTLYTIDHMQQIVDKSELIVWRGRNALVFFYLKIIVIFFKFKNEAVFEFAIFVNDVMLMIVNISAELSNISFCGCDTFCEFCSDDNFICYCF